MPKVSVIIPNYNHADFLEKRIHSVINQTYKDFEIILLDDASSDGSLEIIQRYSRHPKVSKVFANAENSGFPFLQWKKGIEAATGEYIWIAESDDWNELNFIEELLKYLVDRPNVGIVFCRSNFVDAVGNSSQDHSMYREELFREGKDALINEMAYYNIIHNASSVLFKKSLAPLENKQVLSKRFCGDWLFWCLMLSKSDLAFCNQKLNYYRRHSRTVSAEKESNHRYFIEGIDIPIFIFKACILDNYSKLKILSFWSQKFRATLYRKKIIKFLVKYVELLTCFSRNQADVQFLVSTSHKAVSKLVKSNF
jgi:glycosyltransferase involved in cell wall biosynthesis